MFFRREKPRPPAFDDYLAKLKEHGFAVQPGGSGSARVSKYGFATEVEDPGEGQAPRLGRIGAVAGDELAYLVNGGYQQFFVTNSGRKLPALATQLRALHAFREDVKDALELDSYYNEGLGTVSQQHLYDRVKARDTAGSPAPEH